MNSLKVKKSLRPTQQTRKHLLPTTRRTNIRPLQILPSIKDLTHHPSVARMVLNNPLTNFTKKV